MAIDAFGRAPHRRPAAIPPTLSGLVIGADPRRAALGLGAVVGVALLMAVVGAVADIDPLDVGRPWSVPAYLTAGLLTTSAVLAFVRSRTRHGAAVGSVSTAPAAGWLALAGLLAVLAFDLVAQVSERVGGPAQLAGGVAGALALLALARLLAGAPGSSRAGRLVAVGAGLWAAALLLGAFDGRAPGLAQTGLGLAGAASLAAGLFLALRADLQDRPVQATRLRDVAVATPPLRLAGIIGAGIVLFAVLGSFHQFVRPVAVFDLDSELTVPTYYSGVLLLLAAGMAALCVSVRAPGTLAWRVLTGFFAFMALDEVVGVHELLAGWAGLYWQILYVPIMLAGALGFLGVMWAFRAVRAVPIVLALGGLLYVTGQGLDTLQWSGGELVASLKWTTVPEEILEMTGVTLWSLGFLIAVQFVLRGRTEQRAPIDTTGAQVIVARRKSAPESIVTG